MRGVGVYPMLTADAVARRCARRSMTHAFGFWAALDGAAVSAEADDDPSRRGGMRASIRMPIDRAVDEFLPVPHSIPVADLVLRRPQQEVFGPSFIHSIERHDYVGPGLSDWLCTTSAMLMCPGLDSCGRRIGASPMFSRRSLTEKTYCANSGFTCTSGNSDRILWTIRYPSSYHSNAFKPGRHCGRALKPSRSSIKNF